MGQRDFALLFLCITDLGAEIVRDLAIDKIGNHFPFTDYLATVKHHMFHQWDKKKRICCECPKPGCAIKKTVQLSKNIFEKLFVYVKGVCHNGYTRKNGTALVQICVCEYNVRNVSITDLDLTELNSVLLNSPLSSLLTPCENIKLSALMNVRNKVCHSIGSNTFSELELTSLWTELFEALSKLSSIQSKYLKMMIEDKKQKDLSETELTELLLKVDKIEKDTEMFTYHIEKTKRLETEVEGLKISNKRLEENCRNLGEQFGELKEYVGKCTASISFSSLATPGSHLEEGSKEIDIKMKLTNIDEEKMRNGLEKETSLNRNDGLIFNAVKEGCILLEINALSDIFSSEKILNSTLQALVERILTAGEVNTSEKAEIFLNLCIKSPLTAEEEKNIRSVCAGSSELLRMSAFRKILHSKRNESHISDITEEYELTVEDKEDTKLNTGGTEDMEGCQILQNDNEEVVECPECLYNFKCALCCSKDQTVQEMRSKLERDNIQIKQVMRLLQGLNSTKYELPESSIKKIKTKEYDLTVKSEAANRQEHTETLFVDEPCDVCGFKEKEDENELVYCDKCNVLVHQACYNIPVVPDGDWFCRPCLEGVQPKCVLCDQIKGAMVKTSDGKEWAHVQCVWWLPDIKFVDGKKMEKMESLNKISKRRWKLECSLCKKQEGACIQCCVKGCFKAFHSRCAFKNRFFMQIIEEPVLQFKPHCEDHSIRSVAGIKNENRLKTRKGTRKRLFTNEGQQQQTVDDPCDVCGFKDKDEGNELVYCEHCNVLVHQACYNIPVVPDDDWLCRPCSEGVQPKCVLCNHIKGAMVKTSDGKKWAHVQCVWWLPDITFEDGKQMEKMKSLDKISKMRWKLECCLCKKQKGACIQCCVKGCFKAFHSRCAFKNGLRMQIIEEPILQFKPHCEEHSKSSVTETTIAKRQGKRGRPSKRVNSEESRKLPSESPKKKRKVGGKRTLDITLEEITSQNDRGDTESPKKKRKVGGKRTPDITLEEITSQNDRGDTCLHVAALKSDLKQIRHLLDSISKASLIQNCIDIQNNKSRTPLFISVLNNDSDMVELFLQHGANPNIFAEATGGQKGQRDAAIHVAASGGSSYLKTVEALLADETISLNSFNTEGYTALHLAVMTHGREISKTEHVDSECIIKKLIDAGIDPNLQETKSGRTPLMCAIEKLDVTLVERFVRRIDHTKMRQLLKSESFDGKNVHSIIEELKDSFAKNNYRKLTDLLRNINEDPQSHYQ